MTVSKLGMGRKDVCLCSCSWALGISASLHFMKGEIQWYQNGIRNQNGTIILMYARIIRERVGRWLWTCCASRSLNSLNPSRKKCSKMCPVSPPWCWMCLVSLPPSLCTTAATILHEVDVDGRTEMQKVHKQFEVEFYNRLKLNYARYKFQIIHTKLFTHKKFKKVVYRPSFC
jgi:hypothetical protein